MNMEKLGFSGESPKGFDELSDLTAETGNFEEGVENNEENSAEKSKKRGFLRKLGKKVRGFVKEEQSDRRKTRDFEKKARKKGYSKNDAGEWVNKDGELVPGFKLDEEYPEIAGFFETSIDKHFGRFKKSNEVVCWVRESLKKEDRYSYKDRFYKGAEFFSLMKEEDWDNVAAITSRCGGETAFYSELLTNTRAGEDVFLAGLEKNSQRRKTLDAIYDAVGEVDQWRADMLAFTFAPTIMEFYSEEAKADGFVDAVSQFIKAATIDPRQKSQVARGLRGVLVNDGGEYVDDFLKLYQPISDFYEPGLESERTKNNILVHYVSHRGMKATTGQAMAKIFDLMDQRDDEVNGIGNDFSSSHGGFFGLEDYTVECFASASNPLEIDRLVRIHNEIPTTNFANREQNRKDALLLQDSLILQDRTFIHEEYPGVHEVVSAMVDIYDAPDDKKLEKKNRFVEVAEQYHVKGSFGPRVFSMVCYDEKVKGSVKELTSESMIDILRRLKKNTEPVPIEAPKTKYPELNEALEKINPIVNEKTGEIRVSLSDIGDAVTKMNKMLGENSGKVGIFPSTISAVAYLDKMAAYAIRGMSKKEWGEAVFDPVFKEVVRFSEMTSSTGKNNEGFETFYNRMRRMSGEGFGTDENIDNSTVRNAYLELHKRIEGNVEGLSDIYKQGEETARFSGALWSGNLAHELIGLYEKYSA